MSKCAWCNRTVSAAIPDMEEVGETQFYEWVRNHHSRLCAALWEAQADTAPPAVREAAHVLYWWVQNRVANNPRAAALMQAAIDRPLATA